MPPTGWSTCFPLPADAAAIVKEQHGECANLGLWLDRYVDWTERGKNSELQPTSDAKERWGASALRDESSLLLEEIHKRQRASFVRRGYQVTDPLLILRPDYRIVVGLGAEHVLETGLCLHRIYGIPIIPGSALKGVARAWAFWQIVEDLKLGQSNLSELEKLLEEGEGKAQEAKWKKLAGERSFDEWRNSKTVSLFYRIFGTTARRGEVIFFDAYPNEKPKFRLDIMNPHYVKYYSGGKKPSPPADYDNPTPVYFLTVEDTPFAFALASRKEELLGKAEEWLKDGLSNLGVGGKTSSGYGYFGGGGESGVANENGRSTATIDPEQELAESLIKRINALRINDVAGQLPNIAQEWNRLQMAETHKRRVAQAIYDKVKEARRESASRSKPWFQAVLTYLPDAER